MAADESYPDDLKYHREHDWARVAGDTATLGVTWYAQDALGEIVHYEPPEVGSSLARDESYGEVESVKAVSDLIAPLSGDVVEVNQAVVEAPETINSSRFASPMPAKWTTSSTSGLTSSSSKRCRGGACPARFSP